MWLPNPLSLMNPLTFLPLVKIILLLLNAITVLSEDRFLARIGLSTRQPQHLEYGVEEGPDSMGAKMFELFKATRVVVKYPLIGVNVLVIMVEMVLG